MNYPDALKDLLSRDQSRLLVGGMKWTRFSWLFPNEFLMLEEFINFFFHLFLKKEWSKINSIIFVSFETIVAHISIQHQLSWQRKKIFFWVSSFTFFQMRDNFPFSHSIWLQWNFYALLKLFLVIECYYEWKYANMFVEKSE